MMFMRNKMVFSKSSREITLATKHEMQIIPLFPSFISMHDECRKSAIYPGKNEPKTSYLQGCFFKCNGYNAGIVPA